MMKRLLIVWHSLTGGAGQLATAVAEGARQAAATRDPADAPVEVHLLAARHTTPDDVLAASGYVFVAPENLASLSGVMKDFFDRIYYPALDRINGRPYACVVCAGSDGTGAVRQLQRIATGLRLKEAAPARIVITHAQTPEAILALKRIDGSELAQARDLGAAFAAGLASGVF